MLHIFIDNYEVHNIRITQLPYSLVTYNMLVTHNNTLVTRS
jgi:hypothetical protein